MIRGLPASLMFHAAFIGAGYVAWPFVSATSVPENELVVVPIELIDLGEVTNIAPVREPDPEPEEEAPPEPEPTEEDLEPEPEPDPVDESIEEGDVDTAREAAPPEEIEPENVLPDFEAEPEEADPEPEKEEPKPEPEKPVERNVEQERDELLDLFDSTFESERETRKRQPEPEKTSTKRLLEDTPPKPDEIRKGAGERTGNTARLEALLYAQIKSCWRGVDDLPDYKKLNVEMRILLDRDGNLMEDVRLLKPTREPIGRTPMRTAVERAKRAVRSCEPYRLPQEEYADWDDYHTIRLGPAYE